MAVGALAGALLLRFAPIVVAQDEEAGKPVDVIRAQRIELVDERGRARAQLTVEPDGEAVLRTPRSGGDDPRQARRLRERLGSRAPQRSHRTGRPHAGEFRGLDDHAGGEREAGASDRALSRGGDFASAPTTSDQG